MENLTLIQARISSTRLPRKNILPFCKPNETMLSYVLRASLTASLTDKTIICLPDEENVQEIIEKYSKHCKIALGIPVNDVLSRLFHISKEFKPKKIIRLTADCPLLYFYPDEIDKTINYHDKNGYDYTWNRGPGGVPSGLDVEVMNFSVLQSAFEFAGKDKREHVTTFIKENPDTFRIGEKPSPILFKGKWSIDTLEDFYNVEDVFKFLYRRMLKNET
jgi:spore coat polysaccharide biosynthesis protein SpsF